MRWTPLRRNILMTLAMNEPMTRRQLVKRLHTARTTLYYNLKYLETEGRVERFHVPNHQVGRPLTYWRYKQ